MEQRPELGIDEVEWKGTTGLLAVQNRLVETTNGSEFGENLKERSDFGLYITTRSGLRGGGYSLRSVCRIDEQGATKYKVYLPIESCL
jgi:hypothetical protein